MSDAIVPQGLLGIAVVMDCADPRRLATFWQSLVGGSVVQETASDEWVAIEGIPQFDYLGFQQVPEGKAAKNRTHIDVMVEKVEKCRDQAVALGATAIGGVVEQEIFRHQVMADLEGNEFCFVQRKAPTETFGS